jgi:hypothetical protein
MVPIDSFRVYSGQHPNERSTEKNNPGHPQAGGFGGFLVCESFPNRIKCRHDTRGKGDLPYRVNAMEAVNAATLPHQPSN